MSRAVPADRTAVSPVSGEMAVRPSILGPFLVLLTALVLGAALVLGPIVGRGLARAVGPLATLGWLAVSVYAVGTVWLVLVRWPRREPPTDSVHGQRVTWGHV